MSDGRQGGMPGEGDRFRVLEVMQDTSNSFGMSSPSNVLGVLIAARPRVLVVGYGPGPVGQAMGDHLTIDCFHEGAFQAAGTSVEQKDIHVVDSGSHKPHVYSGQQGAGGGFHLHEAIRPSIGLDAVTGCPVASGLARLQLGWTESALPALGPRWS